jgi:hypothetical protein
MRRSCVVYRKRGVRLGSSRETGYECGFLEFAQRAIHSSIPLFSRTELWTYCPLGRFVCTFYLGRERPAIDDVVYFACEPMLFITDSGFLSDIQWYYRREDSPYKLE